MLNIAQSVKSAENGSITDYNRSTNKAGGSFSRYTMRPVSLGSRCSGSAGLANVKKITSRPKAERFKSNVKRHSSGIQIEAEGGEPL